MEAFHISREQQHTHLHKDMGENKDWLSSTFLRILEGYCVVKNMCEKTFIKLYANQNPKF